MKTSKAHLDYWKLKLRKQKLHRDEWETAGRSRNWEIYIQYRGHREWFNLGTPNKDAAAAIAREVYAIVRGAGWDAARRKFKPEMVRTQSQPTIGEFLGAVEKLAVFNARTLHTYSRKLRCLAAAIAGSNNTEDKYDTRGGGHKKWREKIDSVRTNRLTISSIQAWKKQVLTEAGDSPLAEAQAKRTINSTLRNAKSLFTQRVLKKLPFQLVDPVEINEVEFEAVSKPRYRSKIDVRALVDAAYAELRETHPQRYKIFLLALGFGLRRREIDGLLWSQFDFAKCLLKIETTHYTALKSESSEEDLDVSKELLVEFQKFKDAAFTEFVIEAPRLTKKLKDHEYRCDAHFKGLIGWLKAHGVADRKPMHALRKEFGSAIAGAHGIYAASTALRHSSIGITRDYYLDKKLPIYFPFSMTSNGDK